MNAILISLLHIPAFVSDNPRLPPSQDNPVAMALSTLSDVYCRQPVSRSMLEASLLQFVRDITVVWDLEKGPQSTTNTSAIGEGQELQQVRNTIHINHHDAEEFLTAILSTYVCYSLYILL